MSAGIVYDSLIDDPRMAEYVGDRIYPDYSMETAPSDDLFIVMRWGDQTTLMKDRGPETLTVIANQPREMGSDYTVLNDILDLVKEIVLGLEQAEGRDRRSVTSCSCMGMSGNGYDPGFNTITRSVTFQVLLRVVA